MATSATFPAFTALLALVRAAVPSTVLVYDGRPVTNDYNADAVYVGVQSLFESDRGAIEAQTAFVGMPALHLDEDMRIYCVAYSWSGESADYSTLRATAASYIGLIETAMRSNAALSDVLVWGRISIDAVNQGPSDEGCSVDVQFSIVGKARI